jgi:hypothetical protein
MGKAVYKDFRETAREQALIRGAQASIVGHIHKAETKYMPLKEEYHHKIGNINNNQAPINLVTIIVTDYTYHNTGDGFTHGTGLLHNNEGFKSLDKNSYTPSKLFDLSIENPLKHYRATSKRLLQTQYSTFLATVDLEKGWSHSASHNKTTLSELELNPIHTITKPEAHEQRLTA